MLKHYYLKVKIGQIFDMSIIINKTDELPLILKLLKKIVDGNEDDLTESETLIAHELYEDLKDHKWH